MDGYEASLQIRGLSDSRARTPIVALTANALSEDRQRCADAGMDDYLPKPVTVTALVEMLTRHLGVDPAPAPAGEGCEPSRSASAAESALKVFDPTVLASLSIELGGAEPGFAEEIRQLFEDDTRVKLGEVDSAFQAGDRAAVQRQMHALRSASAQVGALELAGLPGVIEGALRAGDPLQAQWPGQWHAAWSRLEAAWRAPAGPVRTTEHSDAA